MDGPTDGRALHVFGYGSLLFRPDFPFSARRGAYVSGWQRRLDQGSPDHRGTPSRLGRVATLVFAPDARCGGAVYTIDVAHRDQVLAQLDHRERGGYARIEVEAFFVGRESAPHASVMATTWIATAENPYYLGPAAFEAMVAQIRTATGPSGANADYVRHLAGALAELGVEDPDIALIADALKTETK